MYAGSSQARFWTFSKDSLEESRREACERAHSPLTAAEESALRTHHALWLQKCADSCAPPEAAMTAVALFHRLHARCSVSEHDLQLAMLTCLYLGCKAEEIFVDPRRLIEDCARAKGPSRPPEDVVAFELRLVNILKFQLRCYHPTRTLSALLAELAPSIVSAEMRARLTQRCAAAARAAMASDATLLFPPAAIALAALRVASEGAIDPSGSLRKAVDMFIERHIGRSCSAGQKADVMAVIEAVEASGYLVPVKTSEIRELAQSAIRKLRARSNSASGGEASFSSTPSPTPPPSTSQPDVAMPDAQ
eukprot:m51a1_g1224 putative cyclin h (306) ;mRNA; f:511560-512542